MRILHTADWHLGKIVNEINMIDQQIIILKQLEQIIINQQIDTLMISGDIFDRSVASAVAIQLFDQVLERLVNQQINVIIIGGNHDGYERLEYAKNLLKTNNVYIQANTQELYQKITIDQVNFYLVNYFDPVTIKKITGDQSIKTHNQAFVKIINNINQELKTDETNIMLAHGYFANLSNSEVTNNYEAAGLEISESERALAIGGADLIDVSIAENFNYIALGHLHKPQTIIKDKCYYSGSLYPYSFSEANHQKGCYVIDTNNLEITFEPFNLSRKFVEINGNFNEIMDKYQTEQITDYVKINLSDQVPIINVVEKLKPIFRNIMQITYPEINFVNKKKVNKVKIDVKADPIQLFTQFYEEVTDQELNQEQEKIIKKFINKQSLKENNASD